MYLLLGKNGYVGSTFINAHSASTNIISPSRNDLNHYNKSLLTKFIIDNKINFLMYDAGFTGKPNADDCELTKNECLLGNTVLSEIICEVCENLKIP